MLIHTIPVTPSTISQQGSHETDQSLPAFARQRENGLKNYGTIEPLDHQSRNHIHARLVSVLILSFFLHPLRELTPSTQHKAMVQKAREEDREEMLRNVYKRRRSKGMWLFSFPPFTQFSQLYGHQGILQVTRISKVRFPPVCGP